MDVGYDCPFLKRDIESERLTIIIVSMVREMNHTNYQFLHEISLPLCSLNICSTLVSK